ncbi:methyl-accepting chemotaxis protein [Desulfitispora alkaliphila]|uniref:methyl-accepting chemotaxis protein n=1 Tax=Desulfitispora alkaliphila TaxID=622674 RepID=UPI003D20E75F
MKLTPKVLITVILSFVIAFSSIGAFGYISAKNLIAKLTEEQLENNLENLVASGMETIADVVEQNRQNMEGKNNGIALALARILSLEGEGMGEQEASQLAKDMRVDDFYVTDGQGTIIYGTDSALVGQNANSVNSSSQLYTVPREEHSGEVIVAFRTNQIEIDYQNIVENIGFSGSQGMAFMVDDMGVITAHSNLDKVGLQIEDMGIAQTLEGSRGILNYELEGEEQLGFYRQLDGNTLVMTSSIAQVNQSVDAMRTSVFTFTLIVLLAVSLVMVFLVRIILKKPLLKLVEKVELLEQGDLTVQFTSDSKDEIGQLNQYLDKTVGNIRTILDSTKDQSVEVNDYASMLQEDAERSSTSIEEINKTVDELAKGASEQAQEANLISESISQLSEKISAMSESGMSMEQIAGETAQLSKNALGKMNQLQNSFTENNKASAQVEQNVRQLADKSQAINNITETIEAVSEQTNLLALNAAIEAARAGEAGRGFAVVAEEIRKLAEQTTTSTQEIAQIVAEIRAEIENVNSNMGKAGEVLSAANASVDQLEGAFEANSGSIDRILQQIKVITEDIQVVNQEENKVSASINNITAVIEENSASTEEVAATMDEQTKSIENNAFMAEKLKALAEELKTKISYFKTQ